MAHHQDFRNLLHVNKLDAFRKWVQTQGYKIHPTPNPEKNIYECLRIELYDRAGNNPHLVFYERLNAVHVSIPEAAARLVRQFIDETQSPAAKRRKEAKRKKRHNQRSIERSVKHKLHTRPKVQASTITKDQIQKVLAEVEEMDLPDGAYWAMCHEKLGLEYGDLFPLIDDLGL